MSVTKSWTQEMESAHLYRELSRAEPLPERRALFERLAQEAESQAGIWAAAATRASEPLPARFVPSARVRVVAALARRLGAERVLHVLAAMKVRGLSVYGATAKGHPLPASADEIGKRHRGAAGGNLRAAVFGVNDGLVSNASLILGVAGATGMAGHAVLISGAAGLLAGAFSMAAGEFVSVSSQREMLDRQVEAEREELALYPEAEAAELSLIYQARGLPRQDADRMAERIVANPAYALDALVREELGVDPASLGSPWGAAGSSFVSFATGAFIPLVPFLVTGSSRALPASLVVTAAALFGVGATMSLFSGRSALHGGLRMLVIGAAAAGGTFSIGHLLGVAVG